MAARATRKSVRKTIESPASGPAMPPALPLEPVVPVKRKASAAVAEAAFPREERSKRRVRARNSTQDVPGQPMAGNDMGSGSTSETEVRCGANCRCAPLVAALLPRVFRFFAQVVSPKLKQHDGDVLSRATKQQPHDGGDQEENKADRILDWRFVCFCVPWWGGFLRARSFVRFVDMLFCRQVQEQPKQDPRSREAHIGVLSSFLQCSSAAYWHAVVGRLWSVSVVDCFLVCLFRFVSLPVPGRHRVIAHRR
jgi:hypothetical protein